jgi:hypothetical protein
MVLPPTVIVAPGASRSAGVLLGVLATGTTAVVVALPLELWLQSGLIVSLVVWTTLVFHRLALRRGARAVTEVRLAANRLIAVRHAERALVAGHVRSASHVGSRLTTIVWKPDGARWSRTVLLLPDMLPPDDFRRLRVLLRYARSDDVQGVPASHA